MELQHQAEIAALNHTHSSHIKKQQKIIDTRDQQISKLNDQLSTAKVCYQEQRSQTYTTLEKSEDYEQQLRDVTARYQTARRSIADLNIDISTLNINIDNLEATVKAQQAELGQAQARLVEAQLEAKAGIRRYQAEQAKVLENTNRKLAVALEKKEQSKKRKVKTAVAELQQTLNTMFTSDESKIETVQRLYKEVVCTTAPLPPPQVDPAALRKQKSRLRQALPQEDVKAYLDATKPKAVISLLPTAVVSSLSQRGAQDFSNELCVHWSFLVGAYLIKELGLSRRKYNNLRNVLFKRYNKTDGVFTKIEIHGVEVPLPPSYTKVKKWRKVQKQDYDVNVVPLDEGAAAAEDLPKALSRSLQDEIDKGHFHFVNEQLVSVLNNKEPVVQISFDAAHTCRGRKTTAFAIKYINGAFSNHYKYTHTFALMEGGDDHAQIAASLSSVIESVNALVLDPFVQLEDQRIRVSVYGTADQAAVHSTHGMCGSDHLFSCPFCLCPNTKFSNPAAGSGFERRNMEQLQLLAHTREGTCPGCKMEVTKNVTNPKTQMPLVTAKDIAKGKIKQPLVPDSVPKVAPKPGSAPTAKAKKPTWNQCHFGKRYGVPPLILIEPSRWAICLLHCNLRVVGTMFKKTVFENLTNKPGDLLRAQQLYTCLLENSIPVDRVKQTSDNVADYYDSISKHGFAGEDCTRLLAIYPQLLEILFPPAEREELGRTTQAKIQQYYEVWQYWAEHLWTAINEKTVTSDVKANIVKERAAVFCSLWESAFGQTPTLYLHLLAVHLPEQIKDYPADPIYFVLQGLEHCNKKRKQYKLLCNNHKRTKKIFVPAYVKVDGTKVKQSKEKSTGPTMTELLLETVILNDIIDAQFLGVAEEQKSLEQARRTNKLKRESIKQTCLHSSEN